MTRPVAFFALLLTLVAGSGHAPAQDGDTAQPFKLRVTSDTVNIRSHADVNSRVVLRVPEDTVLDALALDGDWYRILPPEGVFSYVSADYIARIPGTPRGRVQVAAGTLRVRVGSAVVKLNPARCAVQTRLPDDAEVEILGEEDGWYQIVPPEGVHFYVSASHTKPVEAAHAARLEQEAATRRTETPRPVERPVVRDVQPSPVNDNQPLPAPRQPVIEGQTFTDAKLPELEPAPRLREEPIVVRREEPAVIRREKPDTTAAPTTTGRKSAPEIVYTSDQTTPTAESATPTRTSPFGQPIPARPTQPPNANQPAVVSGTPTANPPVNPPPVQSPPTVVTQQPVRPTPAPQPVPQQPRPLPRFVAEGILQPNFSLPMGSGGLRYELQHPYTRKVIAFAEFGASVQANPTSLVGQYVGIVGPRFTEPQTGQQIVRVTGVTALPRPRGTLPNPRGLRP